MRTFCMMLLMLQVIFFNYAMEDQAFEYAPQIGSVNNESYQMETTRLLDGSEVGEYSSLPLQNSSEMQVEELFLPSFNQLPEELKEHICDYVNIGTLYALAPYFVWPGSVEKKIIFMHHRYLSEEAQKIKRNPMKIVKNNCCCSKGHYFDKEAYDECSCLITEALNFLTRSKKYATKCADSYADLEKVQNLLNMNDDDFRESLEEYSANTQNQIDYLYHSMNIPSNRITKIYLKTRRLFLSCIHVTLKKKLNKKGAMTCCIATSPKYIVPLSMNVIGLLLFFYSRPIAEYIYGPPGTSSIDTTEDFTKWLGGVISFSSIPIYLPCCLFDGMCMTNYTFTCFKSNKEKMIRLAQERIEKMKPRSLEELV